MNFLKGMKKRKERKREEVFFCSSLPPNAQKGRHLRHRGQAGKRKKGRKRGENTLPVSLNNPYVV